MRIVLLGPPGAGKGTMASGLKNVLNIPHISTGDLFRYNISHDTELGKKVKLILSSGDLVPDEITIDMVNERIKKDDSKNGFILDGFPRTINQAEALSNMIKLDYVINLVISEDEIIRRLSGRRVCLSNGHLYHIEFNPPKVDGIDDETGEELIQRDDDKPEAISNRLNVYNLQTLPLIDYYMKKKLIMNVDASLTPSEILSNTVEILKKS